MAPKQKQAKRTDRTPEKFGDEGAKAAQDTPRSPANAVGDNKQRDPVGTGPAPAADFERPKISKGPMYFFAASFLYRSLISPYWSTLKTTGVLNRPSYPSAFTAPGVTCAVEALDGPKFCEHEIVFAEQGVALLSCDAGRGEWNTVMGPLNDPNPRGQLWLYDYADTKTSRALDLTDFPVGSDFHPLGIDYFQDALETTLFVINHQRTGPSIELFSLDFGKGTGATLKHKRTVPAHADLKSANGIVALSHDQMYITNDHAWTRLEAGAAWAMTETFTGPIYGQGWITHVDLSPSSSSASARSGGGGGGGATITRAWSGIPFANGIARGSEGHLYVASSVDGAVHVLHRRNASTVLLMESDVLQFGYSIDNVHVESQPSQHDSESEFGGRTTDIVYVGGHPSFLSLFKVARNPHDASRKAPSWLSVATHRPKSSGETETDGKEKVKPVPRVGQGWHEPSFNQEWDTRTIYQDDGAHFSAATGVSIDKGRDISISPGLYESGVLVCRGVSAVLH